VTRGYDPIVAGPLRGMKRKKSLRAPDGGEEEGGCSEGEVKGEEGGGRGGGHQSVFYYQLGPVMTPMSKDHEGGTTNEEVAYGVTGREARGRTNQGL